MQYNYDHQMVTGGCDETIQSSNTAAVENSPHRNTVYIFYYTIIVFNRIDILAFNRLASGDSSSSIKW